MQELTYDEWRRLLDEMLLSELKIIKSYVKELPEILNQLNALDDKLGTI